MNMIKKIMRHIRPKRIDEHPYNNVSSVLVLFYEEIGGIRALVLAYMLGRNHARREMKEGRA